MYGNALTILFIIVLLQAFVPMAQAWYIAWRRRAAMGAMESKHKSRVISTRAE
jgi:hypothetical protein